MSKKNCNQAKRRGRDLVLRRSFSLVWVAIFILQILTISSGKRAGNFLPKYLGGRFPQTLLLRTNRCLFGSSCGLLTREKGEVPFLGAIHALDFET